MKQQLASYWILALVVIPLLAWSKLAAQDGARTVIGPRNVALAEGADALLSGDGEEGVRLTLLGLETALGSRELKTAHANLCAGYVMLDRPREALTHCDWVLQRYANDWRAYNNRALAYLRLKQYAKAAEDVRRGQQISPNARQLKLTRSLVLEASGPVPAEGAQGRDDD